MGGLLSRNIALQTLYCNQRMQTIQLQRSLFELCNVNCIDTNFLGTFVTQGAQLDICVPVGPYPRK